MILLLFVFNSWSSLASMSGSSTMYWWMHWEWLAKQYAQMPTYMKWNVYAKTSKPSWIGPCPKHSWTNWSKRNVAPRSHWEIWRVIRGGKRKTPELRTGTQRPVAWSGNAWGLGTTLLYLPLEFPFFHFFYWVFSFIQPAKYNLNEHLLLVSHYYECHLLHLEFY